MSLRMTQGIMYSGYIRNLNSQMNTMWELNTQSSTQKRINRPSDDPSGTAQVFSFRNSLDNLDLYNDNIRSAKGWISTGNSILSTPVPNLLESLTRLATQGSSETYMKENREQIALELRALFKQLINYANTDFNGEHIFAGHKTDLSPYVEALGVTCNDPAFAGSSFSVEGQSSSTVIIQATSTGLSDAASYRYSSDGGRSWLPASVDLSLGPPYTAGQMRIDAGGVGVIVDKGLSVQAVDIDNVKETNNGTWIYARPTAVYRGDDDRVEVVTGYGTTSTGQAEGTFSRDLSVRIDAVGSGTVTYSYSPDDGVNWIRSSAPDAGAQTKLAVPGGYLNLSGTPSAGEQFIIHPRQASIDLYISRSDTISLNMVGKKIFGGLYQDPDPAVSPGYPTVVPGSGNLFETVGRLIAAAESNSSHGMQIALEELKEVRKCVLTAAAQYGARSERLSYSEDALSLRTMSEEEGLSRVEDIDFAKLNVLLAQQETAYRSVLKSSSMIMQMSLVNFL